MTKRLCSVGNCNRPHSAHGYCTRHANQFYRHGRAMPDAELRQNVIRVCSVEGCDNRHSAHGYCNRHAKQFKRHGRIIPDASPLDLPRFANKSRADLERLKREAAEARRRGERIEDIAARLGVTPPTITKWTAHLKVRAKARPYEHGAAKYIGTYHPKPLTDEEYKRRMAEIPPDTRDLSARLCGDPLPGRSALAMRQGR